MYLFWKTNQTGKRYYCFGENKKINGKSVRVKEIYLGTADRIYEIMYAKRDLEKINTYEYGLTIALLQAIRESGLYKILKEVLPFKVRSIPASITVIIILLNKIIEPKSKRGIVTWYPTSVLCKMLPIEQNKLSSQFFFDCLQELNQKRINKIEYRMAKNVKKVEKLNSIICDMTHIETYIQEHEGNKLPQRGRTRSRSGRRIINLALMITRNNTIPLFHLPYPGNINDVTEFSKIIKVLEKRYNFLTTNSKDKITIFIDKGNNSADNINGLEDAHYYFIGRLKPSTYTEMLAKPLSKFKDKYEGEQDIISYSTFIDVYGKRRKVVVIFNKDSYDKSYEEFLDLIERRKEETQNFQNEVNYKLKYGSNRSKSHWQKNQNVENAINRILNKKPTKNLFTYRLSKKQDKIDIKIRINKTQFNKRINLIGKYILFTNRKRWDHNKIIKAFLDQYLIEEQYKTLKGDRIKIGPPRHWTDHNIRADIFLSVLALQIMNLFLMKVRKKKSIELSNNEIIDILEQIKVSYYNLKGSKHEFDLINEMKENEKLLYDKLNLKDKNTFSYIKRAFS